MPWRLRSAAARPSGSGFGWSGTAGALALLLAMALAGCGSVSAVPKHDLPGGVYTNSQYHFRITYPLGWQLNVAPQSSSVSPVTLLITRSGDLQATGSLVSTFTVAVFDASYAPIATAVAGYGSNTTLHSLTISGLPAYEASPVQQPMANSQVSDTHTDYFVVHGGYEYQLSTDAVKGDNAEPALNAMLQSFTILP